MGLLFAYCAAGLLVAPRPDAAAARWPAPRACAHGSCLPALRAAFLQYETLALTRPLLTKASTSGVAYVLGDALSQAIGARGGQPRPLSKARIARSGVAGFVSHGPTLHYWSLFLDRFIQLGSPAGTLVGKIALDQTLFATYLNGAYCAVVEALQLSTPRQAWASVRASAWPSLRASWRFWPAVHALTYSVVPQHLRVLWVDIVEVVWVAILASCVNARRAAEAEAAAEACELA